MLRLFTAGLPLVFEKFLPDFCMYTSLGQFLFKSLLKGKKTVLSSIITFQRYFNGYLNKMMIIKKFYLYDILFVSNPYFTTSHIKSV